MISMKRQIQIQITIFTIFILACAGCTVSTPEDKKPEQETQAVLEGELARADNFHGGSLTVPAYLQGSETDGFLVVEETEDYITYQMDESQQTQAVDRMALNIRESINQVLADREFYPDITGISVNEDCTEFNVSFSGTDLNIYETTLRMSLYIAGEKYQLYQGKNKDELLTTVNYIDGATGELISTGNSKDLH